MEPIYEAALNIPFIPEEDVFFTGVIANKLLNIKLIHESRFSDSRPTTTNYCAYRTIITAHRLKPKDLIYLWHDRRKDCDIIKKWINYFESLLI